MCPPGLTSAPDRAEARWPLVVTGECIALTAAALNPAGTLVAGGTSSGETYLWDVPTQQQVAAFGDQGGGAGFAAQEMTFSPDGSQLAIGGQSVISVWSITARSRD